MKYHRKDLFHLQLEADAMAKYQLQTKDLWFQSQEQLVESIAVYVRYQN